MRRLRLRGEGGVTSVFVAGSRAELQVNASRCRKLRALLPASSFQVPIS